MTSLWFDNFQSELLPRKRFKPYNHSIRRRQEYHFNFNGFTCDQCQVISHRNPDFSYFDDDDVMTVEQNLSYTSLWQQYDQ